MDRQPRAAGKAVLHTQADLSLIHHRASAQPHTGDSVPLSLHLLEEVGNSSHLLWAIIHGRPLAQCPHIVATQW